MHKIAKISFFSFLLLTPYLSAMPPEDLDVAIIGGDFAGLRAALKFKEAGRRYQVFEARDRLGGRAWTEVIEGRRIERGAEFVDPDHEGMWNLIHRYKLPTTEFSLLNLILFLKNNQQRTIAQMASMLSALDSKFSKKAETYINARYLPSEKQCEPLFQYLDLYPSPMKKPY